MKQLTDRHLLHNIKTSTITTAMCIIFLCLSKHSSGQDNTPPSQLFQIYLDNDFINFRGKTSDKAYTSGLRLEYFKVKNNPRRRNRRLFPSAGKMAVNTYGWSIMQAMYSPENLRRSVPVPGDFLYSGGLFAGHSLHSSDPIRKMSIQTELVLGVMGPPSLAEQTQKLVHRTMGFVTPRGWDHQLQTDLLLNMNLTVEKMLTDHENRIELIGGATANAGSMLSSVNLYTTFRAGWQRAYFDGLLTRKSIADRAGRKINFSLLFTPRVEWLFYNALVDGGLFRRWSNKSLSKSGRPTKAMDGFFFELDYGFNLSWKRLGLSVTQKSFIPTRTLVRKNEFGNISLSLAF